MTINSRSAKLSSPNVKVQDVPDKPIAISAAQNIDVADVSFTAAPTGGMAAVYRAISTPGNIEGISYGSSPVKIAGLTAGTTYTFTVRGENSYGATNGYTSATSPITIDYGAIQQIASASPNNQQISFTNIPQTYTDLMIVMSARGTGSSSGSIETRFNGDSASNYSYTYIQGNGSAPAYGRGSNATIGVAGRCSGSSSTSGIFASSICHILNYSSTTANKTIIERAADDENGSGVSEMWISLWRSNSAITSITLACPGQANFAAGSTAILYGIKAAS